VGYVGPDDEEQPGLRLMRTFIASLLAVCMAVFPVAMPRAAALSAHSHAAVSHVHDAFEGATHANASALDLDDVEHEHAVPPDQDEGGSHACCGTTTCHAFRVSGFPVIGGRLSLIGIVWFVCDHQVPSVFSGRLDRPPRTV
jgi:uncharacterized protein involved in copper resistance